jgi:hypothetical protein
MKLLGLIILVVAALLAQSMCVYAGGLRMGESSSMNMLVSSDCACQANRPSEQIVAGSDTDGASADNVAAPTCVATPGLATETRCIGSASGASAAATGKADPAASAVTRKIRSGIHWQSLLPGVMK